jgi:hypothetical protein
VQVEQLSLVVLLMETLVARLSMEWLLLVVVLLVEEHLLLLLTRLWAVLVVEET